MNLLSFLHFFAFFMYVYLGIATYRLNKKSVMNRIMLLLCIFLGIWALGYGFMHATEVRQTAYRWHMVSAVGWNLFIPLLLHLCLLVAGKGKYLKLWVLVLMYVPPIVAVIIAVFFMLHQGMLHKLPSGWTAAYELTYPPVLIFIIGLALCFFIAIWSLYTWGRNTRLKREKKQMRIIIVSSLVAMTLAWITDVMLPVMHLAIVPIMGPLMGMIWVFGQWVAIKKYRLMTLDSSIAVSEIIKSMKDLMVMVNYRGRIIEVSPRTCEILGYRASELAGLPIDTLVSEKLALADELRFFQDSAQENRIFDINLKKKGGGIIPVRISGSAIRDGEGDLLGIVFVGYDLRETRTLLEMQASIEQDMDMAAHVQAGILPSRPPESADWDLFFVFKPFTPVSGDFYDFYMSGDNLYGVSVFDVSGHGVSAGLITMIAKSIVFRVFKSSERFPLNNLMEKVNEELVKEIGHLENFLTGMILRFKGTTVEYVNAGHTQLLCKRAADGMVAIINRPDQDVRGPFLGVPDMVTKFKMMAFTVSPGDQILLYSDALIEARGDENKHYGLARLMDTFRDAPTAIMSEDTVNFIMRDVKSFLGERNFRDDLTLILLTRK